MWTKIHHGAEISCVLNNFTPVLNTGENVLVVHAFAVPKRKSRIHLQAARGVSNLPQSVTL